jgi:hypothetical protein
VAIEAGWARSAIDPYGEGLCSIIASDGAAECSIIASDGAAECSIIASDGAAETAGDDGDAAGAVHAASPPTLTMIARRPARQAERERNMYGLRRRSIVA